MFQQHLANSRMASGSGQQQRRCLWTPERSNRKVIWRADVTHFFATVHAGDRPLKLLLSALVWICPILQQYCADVLLTSLRSQSQG